MTITILDGDTLFVPPKCLTPNGEGVEEPITINQAEARNG